MLIATVRGHDVRRVGNKYISKLCVMSAIRGYELFDKC